MDGNVNCSSGPTRKHTHVQRQPIISPQNCAYAAEETGFATN